MSGTHKKKENAFLNDYAKEKNRLTQEAYEANPKFCPQCGKSLTYEQRFNTFCGKSCATSHNNKGQVRNPTGKGFAYGGKPKPELEEPKYCAHCGHPVSQKINKYCDECIEAVVYSTKKSLDDYQQDKGRRNFLIRVRGRQCEVCQNTIWMGKPIPLELDHMDGDPDNNTEENLRLICPNCHAQTETYKGKGVGNGRFSKRKSTRRQRYNDGKSY